MERPSATASPYGHLHSQAKAVVFNVNRYFLDEKANRGPLLPPAKAIARTAQATKLSEKTVRRICSAYNQSFNRDPDPQEPTFSSPKRKNRTAPVTDFSDSDKCVVRRTVLGFYERKEIPTVARITEELVDKIGYNGCTNSLRKVLWKIGFKCARVNGRRFILERNDIIAARTKFLREMRQHKQSGHPVVYVDELWVNENSTRNCGIDTSLQEATTGVKPPSGKGARLVILHAGTKDGFVNNGELILQAKDENDYYNQLNSTVFEEWFRMQLLPNIPPKSVIVMDNASHHCRQLEVMPTTSWKKADIKTWLLQKGVAVSDDLLKAELFELTSRFAVEKGSYVVDALAAEAGHTVVRLPQYHGQYSPIEQIWTEVKSYIDERNLKMVDLKLLLKAAMSCITPEDWRKAVTHAEELQEHDAKQDRAVDIYVDSFAIQISESSDEFSD